MRDNLAGYVREQTAMCAWRCWRSLGAPALAEPVRDSLIDPEPLIVLTAWLTRSGEDRMAEVAATWCRENHGIVTQARLRKLAHPDDAELAIEVGRLVSLANGRELEDFGSVRFTGKPGVVAEPPVAIRMSDPAMLRMRLRSLMGPTARAEALTFLLTRAPGGGGATSAALAHATLFGQRHLREALNDLAYGGWITRWRSGPRDLRYEVTDNSRLAFGQMLPEWTDWTDRTVALVALSRAAVALDRGTIEAAAAVISIVGNANDSFRALGVSLPDWYGADTPEGLARTGRWVEDATARLTEVA